MLSTWIGFSPAQPGLQRRAKTALPWDIASSAWMLALPTRQQATDGDHRYQLQRRWEKTCRKNR